MGPMVCVLVAQLGHKRAPLAKHVACHFKAQMCPCVEANGHCVFSKKEKNKKRKISFCKTAFIATAIVALAGNLVPSKLPAKLISSTSFKLTRLLAFN